MRSAVGKEKDPRVLLIHKERARDVLYRKTLSEAEPAIEVSFAETMEDVRSFPLPEVILLDLSSPSSLEILLWLRSEKHYDRIPVITLTSSEDAAPVNRAYELGANSCVMKSENGLLAETARGIAGFARVLKASHRIA